MSAERAVTHRFTRTALFICGGLLIWAADFLIIYVVAAIACARDFASATIVGLSFVAVFGTVLTAAAVAATVLLMGLAVRRLRAEGQSEQAVRFIYFLAGAIGGLALIAIVFNALPAWLLATECGR